MSFFEPLPPPPAQPPDHRWAPPIWDRPSEGALPVTVPFDAIVHRDDDLVLALSDIEVYPNGFTINLSVLHNPHRPQDLQDGWRRGPFMNIPRVGVRFADGRVGGRRAPVGRHDVEKNEAGVPLEPFVGMPSGGGGIRGGSRFGVWVFPLPPDGPLEILVALPPPASGEVSTVVDGSVVRAASERAQVIWT